MHDESESGLQLQLVDGSLALMDAAIAGPRALEASLAVSIAEGWEGFPEALPILRASYESSPPPGRWGSLFFIKTDVATLVGLGGFKGPPSADGVVEIGYAIAPAFRGRGLATNAVKQMVRRALADPSVTAVDAHTLGFDNPSTRVLERSGFRRIAEQHDSEEGPVWQWRLARPAR